MEDPGDILIDGGNSPYWDSQRRCTELQHVGIHFMDFGTSGGTTGARHGACLMVGGDEVVYASLEPLCKALSNDFSPGAD